MCITIMYKVRKHIEIVSKIYEMIKFKQLSQKIFIGFKMESIVWSLEIKFIKVAQQKHLSWVNLSFL